MSSHLRPQPRQRVPRSTTVASVAGVGLVVFGVLLSLWQKSQDPSGQPIRTQGPTAVDNGVLGGLQQLVPTLAGVLVIVIVIAGVVLFKGRRHQN